ncbi:MAG: zinc-dependent metalloprotease [Actinobacteria bacterium]|nr:zinc-dependent metalloprotease [Actinomycetota bacterium]
MDAAKVDWSMGSASARLADWSTALDIGRRVAGPGVRVTAVDRARMREDIAELTALSESLVRTFTGLSADGFRARAWVMSRGEWIGANLKSIQRLLDPLSERMVGEHRGEVRRKAFGVQFGALLGYVSRKVLGQYDVFLPPDDEGLIYFVGPNVAEAERRFALPPRDFRLWISLHEVTHRVQFAAAPWLRSYLGGLIDSYLSTVQVDSREMMKQLQRAAEEIKAGAEWRGAGALSLLLTPEQREIFSRMQSLMALLEGHASFVMNEVAEGRVRDLARMRRALQQRRSSSGLERTFQRAIGFESKVKQYDTGERFVREVVARADMQAFNRAWESEANLPTPAEIAEPARWVERVVGR